MAMGFSEFVDEHLPHRLPPASDELAVFVKGAGPFSRPAKAEELPYPQPSPPLAKAGPIPAALSSGMKHGSTEFSCRVLLCRNSRPERE